MQTGLVVILPNSGETTLETTTSADGETTIDGSETTTEGDETTAAPPTLINPYPGCGSTKVCFGTPPGCLITENCMIFSAVIFEDGKFIFELLSGSKLLIEL